MAWNAQLVGKTHEQDRLKVNVRFFNDTNEAGTSFVQEFVVSAEEGTLVWLRKQVYKKLAALTTLDQTLAVLPEGAIIGLPDDTPTAEQVAKTDYQTKLYTYKHALKGVEYGIFTGSEPQIVAQKQWLIDNFQNSYLDLL